MRRGGQGDVSGAAGASSPVTKHRRSSLEDIKPGVRSRDSRLLPTPYIASHAQSFKPKGDRSKTPLIT